jgi:hypothetical protein
MKLHANKGKSSSRSPFLDDNQLLSNTAHHLLLHFRYLMKPSTNARGHRVNSLGQGSALSCIPILVIVLLADARSYLVILHVQGSRGSSGGTHENSSPNTWLVGGFRVVE